MGDRERMKLLAANVRAIAEVDTFLGEQLKLQVEERRQAEAIDAEVRKHRRKAFRWLRTAERRAKKPAVYRPSKVNASVRRLSPLEKTRRKAFQKLATIQRRLAKKAKRQAARKPKTAPAPEPMEVIAPPAPVVEVIPEPVIAEPPAVSEEPKLKPHSRKAKDPSGCGMRLAKKLDRLIAEVLAAEPEAEDIPPEPLGDPPQLESVASDAELSGEGVEVVVSDWGQTPLPCNEADQFDSDDEGACCLNRAGADSPSTDPSPKQADWREFQESALDRLTATIDGGQPETLEELIDGLNDSAELRSAALLRSMERFRDCLDGLPADTPLEAPQELPEGDVLVLVRALMSRLH